MGKLPVPDLILTMIARDLDQGAHKDGCRKFHNVTGAFKGLQRGELYTRAEWITRPSQHWTCPKHQLCAHCLRRAHGGQIQRRAHSNVLPNGDGCRQDILLRPSRVGDHLPHSMRRLRALVTAEWRSQIRGSFDFAHTPWSSAT